MPRSSVIGGAVRVEPRAGDREIAGKLVDATLVSSAGLAELRLADGSIVGLSESLLQILQASAGELAEDADFAGLEHIAGPEWVERREGGGTKGEEGRTTEEEGSSR